MSRTIWKFPLSINDRQTVEMPADAEILSVAMQGDQICLWALVYPDNAVTSRTIHIYGTGHPAPEEVMIFIGTVLIEHLGLVFHVFDGFPE